MDTVVTQLKKFKEMLREGRISNNRNFNPKQTAKFLSHLILKELRKKVFGLHSYEFSKTPRPRKNSDTEMLRKSLAAKVLIVDDENYICKLITTVLTREGFVVDTASNGEEAFAKMQKEQYDLILLDLYMPFLNGEQLLHRIRRHYKLKNAKIIVVSGAKDKELLTKIGKMRVLNIIMKPFNLKFLLAKVKEALEPFFSIFGAFLANPFFIFLTICGVNL